MRMGVDHFAAETNHLQENNSIVYFLHSQSMAFSIFHRTHYALDIVNFDMYRRSIEYQTHKLFEVFNYRCYNIVSIVPFYGTDNGVML